MKLEAQLGSEKQTIVYEEQEDGTTSVILGNQTFKVNSRRVEHDVWSLIIDGQSYEATVQPLKDILRVTIRGASWDIDIYDPSHRSSTASHGTAVEGMQIVSSPMPGRVVTVEVAVGDRVKAGQGVVIVEAMKMENELEAVGPGVVKEIKVKAGEAVEDGQALVIIE